MDELRLGQSLEPAGTHFFKVGLNHDPAQLRAFGFWLPTENLLRLGGIADQEFDFSGAKILRAHLHQHLAGLGIDTLLVDALSFECEFDVQVNSRTECISFVARTKSSGLSC